MKTFILHLDITHQYFFISNYFTFKNYQDMKKDHLIRAFLQKGVSTPQNTPNQLQAFQNNHRVQQIDSGQLIALKGGEDFPTTSGGPRIIKTN